jgi:glycine cleavage system H lipoate-binding protein
MLSVFQKNSKTGLKCIWMTAGVVNYKLCDNNFNCDCCDFDRVMRGMLPYQKNGKDKIQDVTFTEGYQKEDQAIQKMVDKYLYFLLSGCKIHLDRCYYPSHLWIKAESDDTIRIGLDALLIKILEPVDKVVLPALNETYRKNQLITWIVRGKNILPLYSPMKGKVINVNYSFSVSTIDKAMEGDSYLFKMRCMEFSQEGKQAYNNMQGLQHYVQKVEIIKNFLSKAFKTKLPNELGPTLTDGGDFEVNLEKVMGQKAFSELLNALFFKKKNS